MGTIIEASATAAAAAHRRSLSPGALELADAAARSCLDRAGRTAEELDLLVNAGVFHDKILSEPAFASLIQEDIGANLGHPAGAGHGTFSFDVYNGGCGFLTGISLVDGMLSSGTVALGMVVASDMDPEPGLSEGFSFPGVGGAILLSADDSRAGFTAFKFTTFPEFSGLFHSYVDWRDDARGALAVSGSKEALAVSGSKEALAVSGSNVLTVEIAETYLARALDCADPVARELIAAQGLDLDDVDLLVATASVPDFADGLAARFGMSAERVASLPGELAHAHTAAPAVALESAGLADAGTMLFVSVGAGITVAASVYRG